MANDTTITDCSVPLNVEVRRALVFLLYLVIYVTGLILNCTAVWINWSRRNSQNGLIFCAFNMALSDLLSMIVLPFFMLQFTMDYAWIWGQFLCGFLYFVDLTTFYSSSFFLAYMSVERYLGVTRTSPRSWGPTEQRKRLVLCGALWVFSLVPAIVQSSHTRLVQFERPYCFFHSESSITSWIVPFFIVVFQFICPAIVIITSNLLTWCKVRAHAELRHQSRLWLLHLYSVVFVMCWMPKHLFLVLFLTHGRFNILNCKVFVAIHFFNGIVAEISSFHCVANAILYNFLTRGFRQNLLNDVTRLLSRGIGNGAMVVEYNGDHVQVGEGEAKGASDRQARRVNDSNTSQSDVES